MKINISDIDYNKQSLFTTPLGEAVQREKTGMLLGKINSDTSRAKYISSINESLTDISQSFWDIDLTIKLIKFADPKIKSFKMTRVDKGEYIKYHFENYLFRLPKLKDQILNLLNIIFQLNYSQSNGLEKKIRNTRILQEKKLLYFIDYFNEIFSKIKQLRDIIAHRSDLSDCNLTIITSYSLLKYDEKEYDARVKSMIEYTFIFQKNQGILKQAIITLLLVLFEDFNFNLKAIDEQ